MLIDKLAYMSRLKDTDPLLKVIFALFSIIICIWANSFVISILMFISIITLITCFGGTKLKTVFQLLTIPISFLILGSTAVALVISNSAEGMLKAFSMGDVYIGVSSESIIAALRVMVKCISSVSCMYFLSLSTPMIELFSLLRRSIIPDFIVEIMELVYRYIFVLFDAANRIYVAQDSRLGYNTLRHSYRSTGILAANLFIRAYRQAEKTYIAMESRGYNGDIPLLKGKYVKKIENYIAMSVFVIFMAILAVICKGYGV